MHKKFAWKDQKLKQCYISHIVLLGVNVCSYITSMSRISLILHETKGKAWGRVLITMISYESITQWFKISTFLEIAVFMEVT